VRTAKYYSNGKLLISGEYFVLTGATAFAIPVKFGQLLEAIPSNQNKIIWNTYAPDHENKKKLFFTAYFEAGSFETIKSSNAERAGYIKQLLNTASMLSGKGHLLDEGVEVNCHVTFNMEWGLGSSSTLISNVAQWFDIDPFALAGWISGGSGYDIACATSELPILYQTGNNKPIVKKIRFNPYFTENIYFIYSGKKEGTARNLFMYIEKVSQASSAIDKISNISEKLAYTQSLKEFIQLCEEHNNITANVIDKNNSVLLLNKEFEGVVKPLGAWGGDFFMAVSEKDGEYVKRFFNARGYDTLIPYKDMAL
jgi:mevalonate kinase